MIKDKAELELFICEHFDAKPSEVQSFIKGLNARGVSLIPTNPTHEMKVELYRVERTDAGAKMIRILDASPFRE